MDELTFQDLFVTPFQDNWFIIFFSCVACQLCQWGTDFISPFIFPSYKNLNAEKRLDWCVRVVAMVHAFFAMALIPGWIDPDPALATYHESNGTWTYHHFGFSAESQFFYSVSVGYFLWDVIVCIYYKWGFEFLIHGILCGIAYFFCLYPFQHYWGRFYLGVYEISTIPLHLRGCMKLIDTDHRLFLFVQTLWVISYTYCRIFLGGYETYQWYYEMKNLIDTNQCKSAYLCYFFMFINFSMVILMWYWWALIIRALLGLGRQNDRQNAEKDYEKEQQEQQQQQQQQNKKDD